MPYISAEDFGVTPQLNKHDSVVAENLCSGMMFWNFESKKSSAVFWKQACIQSHLWQSAEPLHPFYLFSQDAFGWQNNENSKVHLHHLHFFCRCTELMYQTLLKAVSKIATCLSQRWTAASFCLFLSKETLQFLDSIIKKTVTALLQITASCQWWHYCCKPLVINWRW